MQSYAIIKAQLIQVTIIISKNYFFFRKGLFTNSTMLNVTKYIYENISNDDKVFGIFIDIKKAFNSIDQSHGCHNISINIP